MSPTTPVRSRLGGEERVAILGVLQELTTAVFALFDPRQPVDLYLEKVAARLGCRVVVCLERRAEGPGFDLLGAAGLSRASREAGVRTLAGVAGPDAPIAFPEVADGKVSRHVFPVPGAGRQEATERWLVLFCTVRLPDLPMVHGVARRVAEHLGVALEHRSLLDVALDRGRRLDRANARLERRVAERTRELEESLRQAEEAHRQLLEAAKLAAIGQLAGGVAHEINNPLAAVLANLTHVLEHLPSILPNDLQEALRDAHAAAERAQVVVRDLSTIARPGDDAPGEVVDVHEALRTSIAMARNEIRHKARLVEELDPVSPVKGSAHRVGQVLLNLLVNAAQAIPEGRGADHEIRVRTWEPGPGQVAIEIRDTGEGIAPEVLPRIFDPYYTTKPVGRGTGLGLSICQRIVTALGGEIQVESRPGAGSSFRIVLPAAGTSAPRAAAPREPPREEAGARVLVVDDDPLVGRAVARALSQLHRVSVVQSAEEALALIEGGLGFDVVLSDIMMPGMSGIDLRERALRSVPSLSERFVFLTGGAFTPRAVEFARRSPEAVLEKPLQASQLRDAVAAVLARTRKP